MQAYLHTLLIACPLIFTAGLVDSMAGGGGLISLPALLLAGLPPHAAFGTNKFAGTLGSSVAALKFARSGKIQWRTALMAAAASVICAWLGARVVLHLSERMLNLFMLFVLPAAALFLLLHRSPGQGVQRVLSIRGLLLRTLAIGGACGFYDGIFGPGTGTFLILGFSAFLGLDMVTASGNAKVVNLASNLGACIAYLLGGQVLFAVALPAALCSCLGNYLGARLAIRGGAKYIRPVILLVVGILIAKISIDLFR